MRVRLALLAIPSLLVAGCFDDPVSETLLIQILEEDKAAVVTATVSLQSGPKEGPLVSRLRDLRHEYLNGQDPWTRRFERARFEHEERTLFRERRAEEPGKPPSDVVDLSKVRHMVVIPREELGFLLSDSGVAASVSSSGGSAELLIVPGAGTLSTSEQRRVLRSNLEAWAASAVTYSEEIGTVYDFLSRSPDRAVAIFGHLFGDLLSKEEIASFPLSDSEDEMVEKAREAMNAMARDLTGLSDLPYGLNELSYLVYDPLPAAVTVCIPKVADEVEGFIPKGDLCYSIPRRGILEAFDALEGRWLSPDPFVTWIRIHRSQGQEKLDLPGFAAKPRSSAPVPTAKSILEALEGGMRHERSYRLRWIETVAESGS